MPPFLPLTHLFPADPSPVFIFGLLSLIGVSCPSMDGRLFTGERSTNQWLPHWKKWYSPCPLCMAPRCQELALMRQETALPTWWEIVYSEAKYELSWPGNTYLGYSKFCVPTWKYFYEVFIETKQNKKKIKQKSRYFKTVLVETLSLRVKEWQGNLLLASDAFWWHF